MSYFCTGIVSGFPSVGRGGEVGLAHPADLVPAPYDPAPSVGCRPAGGWKLAGGWPPGKPPPLPALMVIGSLRLEGSPVEAPG